MKKIFFLGAIVSVIMIESISIIYKSYQLIPNQHYWFEKIKNIYEERGGTVGNFYLQVKENSVSVYSKTESAEGYRGVDIFLKKYLGGSVSYIYRDNDFNLVVSKNTFLSEDSAKSIVRTLEKLEGTK